MLNEVRSRHIKKLVVARIQPGLTAGAILKFEIAYRENTIRGLEEQRKREEDEIVFLKSLDAKELHKAAGEESDV
jgi:hypothetical protein